MVGNKMQKKITHVNLDKADSFMVRGRTQPQRVMLPSLSPDTKPSAIPFYEQNAAYVFEC